MSIANIGDRQPSRGSSPTETAEDAQENPRKVHDDGDGRFAVRTVTGTYLLDVTERRLMRSAQP
ncbi:MAG: hypothetical protein WB767_10655, partial [Nocardioides sp.]